MKFRENSQSECPVYENNIGIFHKLDVHNMKFRENSQCGCPVREIIDFTKWMQLIWDIFQELCVFGVILSQLPL